MGKSSTPETFANRLTQHLKAVGWTQSKLAREAGISEAQISGWLGRRKGTPTRTFSRQHVNAVAWALARGYQEKQSRAYGPDNLEALLFDLLESAGYSTASDAAGEPLWRRLASGDRSLVVGWTPYPPFVTESLKGFSVDLAQKIAELLGLQLDWRRYRWGDLVAALNAREIDLIAPVFLTFPNRMFQVRFSQPIPRLFVGLNAVVHREHLSAVRRSGAHAGINFEQLRLAFAAGEVGQIMCTLLAPTAQREEPAFESVEEGCRDVLAHPFDQAANRVRCFVADDVACRRFIQQNRHATLLLPEEGSPVKLALAFASHLEETRFMKVLNACIEMLSASNALNGLFATYKADLDSLGIR